MAVLGREGILAAQDLARELVPVPEWGGEVWVRTLTGTERDRFESESIDQRGKKTSVDLDNMRARLCALAVCDADGRRIFSDADVRDLGGKSAGALARVYDVACRLAGIGAKDVEDLKGNSDGGPASASG